MKDLLCFFFGATAGMGMGLSQMTRPVKVINFLNVMGENWDPTLIFVMAGALMAYTPLYWLIRRFSKKPFLANEWNIPTRRDITFKLVGGSALFGIGWGLVGICPSPATVALASGYHGIYIFIGAMVVGKAISIYQFEKDRFTFG